ncbi:winged helix-turn-helix transcriptional regulator [Paenibacillus sp. GCM10012306]|uniref:winged helix-turn-helix transcriptional regulator n=1 Tax=Paenibacillus sp. GCM10012306 TaxID=3317342 RepID=UPI0036176946
MNEESKPLQESAELAYHIIGKKWVNLIVHVLMEGSKRFNELNAMVPGLSKRMLNERLKELEESGILKRHVIPDRPVRTEYTLTEKGKELGDALGHVEAWGIKWL